MLLNCIALFIFVLWGYAVNKEPIDLNEILLYVLLFSQVLLVAGGTVALRNLKKFNEDVLIWYTSWACLIISLVVVYATGNDLNIIKRFNLGDWLLIIATAVSSTTKQICKIMALQF